MGLHNESYTVVSRQEANAIGVVSADISVNGLITYAPTRHKQDNSVLHDREIITLPIFSTTVDMPIFMPTEGGWRLFSCMTIRRVVGSDAGAVTADVMACASGVAPVSGVTQLSAVDSINLKAPAADIIATHALATSLTEIGPGSYIGLNVTGTLTAVVAMLVLEFVRVR